MIDDFSVSFWYFSANPDFSIVRFLERRPSSSSRSSFSGDELGYPGAPPFPPGTPSLYLQVLSSWLWKSILPVPMDSRSTGKKSQILVSGFKTCPLWWNPVRKTQGMKRRRLMTQPDLRLKERAKNDLIADNVDTEQGTKRKETQPSINQ